AASAGAGSAGTEPAGAAADRLRSAPFPGPRHAGADRRARPFGGRRTGLAAAATGRRDGGSGAAGGLAGGPAAAAAAICRGRAAGLAGRRRCRRDGGNAMTRPLRLSVAGHTNVGKTSLLRTLTRDPGFGEVSARPGTTRHVEGARLSVGGEPLLELYDTPGMEDAIALLEYLERAALPGERRDPPAQIARFLDGVEARQRFEQEAKVLRQLLASDAGLYVVDVREPVLAKYRDELAVLAMCGKPLLPVFNFVSHAGARPEPWSEALARLGLHARVAFDSVAPAADGERRLYESLALLLESARSDLLRLVESHEQAAVERLQAGRRLIAELLLDVAACRH